MKKLETIAIVTALSASVYLAPGSAAQTTDSKPRLGNDCSAAPSTHTYDLSIEGIFVTENGENIEVSVDNLGGVALNGVEVTDAQDGDMLVKGQNDSLYSAGSGVDVTCNPITIGIKLS